ncbi:37S ribosomal protein MRP1, mitochondrial [Hanseniaspora opuntiae]|uniref:37S ribosomal protein MRP1, mitochondrial n=1 Tax=Hanseniaspora opuntiae TaxID=211096 RepID=A0A1E5R8X1_9ASCO|nr:37S ribosomal protein MRP1, mitochondrial [Hanseniaspora opuntiae]
MFSKCIRANKLICRNAALATKSNKVSIVPELQSIQDNASKVWSNDVLKQYYNSRVIEPLEEVMKMFNEKASNPDEAINNVADINQKFITKQLKDNLFTGQGKKTFTKLSLVNNSSFALSSLKGEQAELSINPVQTPNLYHLIMRSFGSLEEFEKLLLLSAKNIQGDGFTWLVLNTDMTRKNFTEDKSYQDLMSEFKMDSLEYNYDNDAIKIINSLHSLKVLNTYNAGSPFVFDRFNGAFEKTLLYIENSAEVQTKRKEKLDALRKELEQRFLRDKDPTVEKDSLSYMYEMYKQEKRINLSLNLLIKTDPVLAIDCSPKLWLLDYGVEGKMEYLKNLYSVTNWALIEKRLVTHLESVQK